MRHEKRDYMDERDRTAGAGRNDESGDPMSTLSALAARMDPVPPAVLEAARATFTWRTIDAELAELAFDSTFSDLALAGVRGGELGPRLLTFEAPQLTVELEVSEVGDARRFVGQLVPPTAAELEIRHPSGATPVTADERGRFSADRIPAGPVSVRVVRSGHDPVETDWITV